MLCTRHVLGETIYNWKKCSCRSKSDSKLPYRHFLILLETSPSKSPQEWEAICGKQKTGIIAIRIVLSYPWYDAIYRIVSLLRYAALPRADCKQKIQCPRQLVLYCTILLTHIIQDSSIGTGLIGTINNAHNPWWSNLEPSIYPLDRLQNSFHTMKNYGKSQYKK